MVKKLIRALISSAALMPVLCAKTQPLTIEAELSRYMPSIYEQGCMISPDGKLVALSILQVSASAPGQVIAYGESATGASAGSFGTRIVIVDADTGEKTDIGGDPAVSSYSAAWAPDSQKLAFLSDRDGQLAVWVWDRRTRSAARVSTSMARPSQSLPTWSADSQSLLFIAAPEGFSHQDYRAALEAQAQALDPQTGTDEQKPLVFSYDPQAQQPSRLPTNNKLRARDLVLLGVNDRSERRLAREKTIFWYAFSPDGRAVAWSENLARMDTTTLRYDVKVQELNAQEPRTVLPRLESSGTYGNAIAWSPDSRRLAFVGYSQPYGVKTSSATMGIVQRDGSQTKVLRKLDFSSEGIQWGRLLPPVWTADGSAVLALFNDGVEIVRVSGEGVTSLKAPGAQLDYLLTPMHRPFLGPGARRNTVLAFGANLADGTREFWSLDIGSGRAQRVWANNGATNGISQNQADMSADERRVVFTREGVDRPPEFWIADVELRRPRKLLDLNPHLKNVPFGKSRLVTYHSADGEELKGALLLPPDYREDQRVPMIVDVYPGTQHRSLNYFGLRSIAQSNRQLLATRGYAVLQPDSRTRMGHPVDSLVACIIPATLHMIELGIADPDAIGLTGYSQGGMTTVALLTRARLFKAAIAGAGYYELFSFQSQGMPTNDKPGFGMLETSNDIETTPWKNQRVFLENSPYLDLDRVRTPLLLLHGQKDEAVSVNQARQLYIALSRLGQKVTLVEYPGEDHGLAIRGTRAHQIDYANRFIGWFDEHLKPK